VSNIYCDIPRYRLGMSSHRAFTIAGPSAWNCLPLRNLNATKSAVRRLLKTLLNALAREVHWWCTVQIYTLTLTLTWIKIDIVESIVGFSASADWCLQHASAAELRRYL